MYPHREIRGIDQSDLRAMERDEEPMPADAGFLMIVCASLLFWLFVLLLFSAL